MKKGLTVITLAIGLVVTVTLSTSRISLVSAAACATESSTFESNDDRSYTVLQFKDVGTCQWTIPAGVNQINYLIVAGGGGGGSRHGGGGGAGGVVHNLGLTPLSVTPGSSGSVTVGAGGAGAAESGSSIAARGGNSSIFFVTTSGIGGGAGSSQTSFNNLQNGGSGGGARGNTSVAGGGREANQGNSGGAGGGQNTTVKMLGGGGGGFSSAGSNGGDSTGNGGAGFNASAFLGTQVGASGWFAGGGGGGGGAENDRGTGGQGGGGNGGLESSGANAATSGQENTGGGGGGGGHTGSGSNFPGKAGGSGIVIVRYITPPAITETNGIVMLVDPRSESVPIPYLTVTSGAQTRVCFDLTTASNSAIALKSFVDKDTDSDAFRMAVTSNDVVVSVGASNALNKITASRTNTQALLKRNVSNSESYLRLYRPDGGWSEVDGGKVKVRVDYAVDSDCSGVSGTEINVEIPIKVLEIGAIQKNPVDLSRG